VRLRLVQRIKSYKTQRGYDFVDPEREEWMLRDVQRANRGPLSAEGLEEIYGAILALSKKEVS
jgi:chorismate mutase